MPSLGIPAGIIPCILWQPMPRQTTFSFDADHEMASLLAIACERAHPSMSYPPHVLGALETAYCAHFRAFMEFVHNGRPSGIKRNKDTQLNAFTETPVEVPWKSAELNRFKAADKLGAHVSRGRAQRRHTKRYWGGPEDHTLVLRRVKEVFQSVPGAKNKFKRTAQHLALLGNDTPDGD